MVKAAQQRTQFFARTAWIIVLLALSSFPFTYFQPFVTGSRHFFGLHHAHAAAFFAWLGLYLWQCRLAASGRTARHREIGLAALLVSGAMVPLGWWMALFAARSRIERGDPAPFVYTFYNCVDISLFALSIIAALATVTRRIEWHRRFMYAAALNLFGPAISRWFLTATDWPRWTDSAPNYIADLMLVVLAIHDKRETGRVHPATILIAAVMVSLHTVQPWIATSEWWGALAPGLLKFD